MNERIKELAEQAELTKGVWKTPDFILEKFAELIVLECANICGKDSLDYRYIKEHFGVKE